MDLYIAAMVCNGHFLIVDNFFDSGWKKACSGLFLIVDNFFECGWKKGQIILIFTVSLSNLKFSYSKIYYINSNNIFTIVKIFHCLHLEVFTD